MRKGKLVWFTLSLVFVIFIFFLLFNSVGRSTTNVINANYRDGYVGSELLVKGHFAFAGFPHSKNTNYSVIHHTGFTIAYSEKAEEPAWVAYSLTKEEVTVHVTGRGNNFKEDPSVSTGSATPADYKHSGYDKGHLAPAADMKWSLQAEQECFFMSNMSPQVPAFNRGVWNRLEERTRRWAVQNDSLFIVTGPVLKDISKFIGTNRVGVPVYFYKAILDISPPSIKAIGFILRNEGSEMPLQSFVVSIDSIEKLTGFDLCPNLPDSLENIVESRITINEWF